MGATSLIVQPEMISPASPTILRPCELTADQLAAWHEIVAADPSLQSPFYQPEFTQAVGQVRDDVRVAVIQQNDVPVAFFPYQQGTSGFGLPVGGKLNDFQGIIGPLPDSLSIPTLLKACGLVSWAFDHVPETETDFAPWTSRVSASPYIDFSHGWAAYQEDRALAQSSIIRETKRKERKLARDAGDLRFEFHTEDDHVFNQLLTWKSAQRRATKTFDILQMDWARTVLQTLRNTQTESVQGCLSALYAGDRLIAAHFGLISQRVMHLWFPAYNVEFSNYSPGVCLMLNMLQEADVRGIERFDLGKGDERFKQRLSNGATNVCQGAVTSHAWVGYCNRVYGMARNNARQLPFRGLLKNSKRWLDTWIYR
ncbi:GNAT family N-acetyltransferase [Bremerella sp. JC770]|uniref:GNAT family N-acetyltransferase n=1 Tax=Bremerella sp. JC770 TaxID=3232137 RepID=UPI0034595B86